MDQKVVETSEKTVMIEVRDDEDVIQSFDRWNGGLNFQFCKSVIFVYFVLMAQFPESRDHRAQRDYLNFSLFVLHAPQRNMWSEKFPSLTTGNKYTHIRQVVGAAMIRTQFILYCCSVATTKKTFVQLDLCIAAVTFADIRHMSCFAE